MQREAIEFSVLIGGGGPAGLAGGDQAQAAGGAAQPGDRCLRDREGVGDRRPHPVRGGDGPTGIQRTRPGAEIERGAAQYAGPGRPLSVPIRARRLADAQSVAAGPLPQSRQLRGSLGNVCRWLGKRAEEMGVEIYPGSCGTEVLYDQRGAVKGVATARSLSALRLSISVNMPRSA